MVLALVIFLAIAVVLTIAAWWLGRKLNRPSADPELSGSDHVDRWLIRHHGLMSVGDCLRVRDAVYQGRALGDPVLKEAAHGLAAEVLSGRLRDRNPGMLLPAAVNVVVGALTIGISLAYGGDRSTLGAMGGTGWLLAGLVWVWRSRPPRRMVKRAALLNEADVGTRASR
jgi:hypothetical protein